MKNRVFLTILYMFLSLFSVSADVNVVIRVPELQDGWEKVEELLYTNIRSAITDIEDMVNNTLDKPKLTTAFSNSTGFNNNAGAVFNFSNLESYTFSIGGSIAVNSYTFDIDSLNSRLSLFETDDDISLGVNGQLIKTTVGIPNFLFSITYLDFSYDDYFYKTVSGSISSGGRVIGERRLLDSIKWIPLSIQGGLAYGESRLGGRAEAGLITREFDYIPDNPFLFSQSVTIEIDPIVDIAMETKLFTFSLSGSSEIVLLDIFHLNFGLGVNFSWGETSISVKSSDEVTVLGYLSDLVETPGNVSMGGKIGGSEPDILTGYLFSSIQADFSTTFISFGILYSPDENLGAGISVGVKY